MDTVIEPLPVDMIEAQQEQIYANAVYNTMKSPISHSEVYREVTQYKLAVEIAKAIITANRVNKWFPANRHPT